MAAALTYEGNKDNKFDLKIVALKNYFQICESKPGIWKMK